MAKVRIDSDGKTFEIDVEEGVSDEEIRRRVIAFLERQKSFPGEERGFPQLEKRQEGGGE